MAYMHPVPSAASLYVANVPGLKQDPQRPLHIYAGHLPSDPDAATAPATDVTAHAYFVLVKNRRIADKERILFWFNGGPGCSSFDGLMMEVGPWRLDGKGGLNRLEGGWEEYTTMVYGMRLYHSWFGNCRGSFAYLMYSGPTARDWVLLHVNKQVSPRTSRRKHVIDLM